MLFNILLSQFCKKLIDLGKNADINARNKLNITPLFLAAKFDKIENIKILIKYESANPMIVSFFEQETALDILKKHKNIMGCYLIENWIKIWKKSMKYRPLRIMVGCDDITRTEIELDFKKDESELSWEKLAESDKKIGKLVKGELCYYCCKEVNDNIIKCNYCNNISLLF